MTKARLWVTVDYDPRYTSPAKLAEAFATLLETAMSTAAVLDEVGDPQIVDVEYDEDFEEQERSRATNSQPRPGT